jgi:hypothetical protein
MLHSYGTRSRLSREGKLKDALFQGMDQFLIDLYRDPASDKAKIADKRFEKLVH